jgi:integrase
MGESRGKKRRARHLPLNDALLPVLTETREAATSKFVVEYRSGPVVSVKSGFGAACRRAKLAGVTPHVLRHSAVSWMVQAGVPFQVIGAYAAMSAKMVEVRYGHHSQDYLRQASDALTGAFTLPSGREIELATI